MPHPLRRDGAEPDASPSVPLPRRSLLGAVLLAPLLSAATRGSAAADAAPAATTPTPLPLVAVPGLSVAVGRDLTLRPGSGNWDLSRYESVVLRLRNPGREAVTVWARAENPEAKGARDTVRAPLVLGPGKAGTLRLRLTRRPEDPTYAPLKPFFMYFKGVNVRDNTVDPAAIARVVVWLDPAAAGDGASAVALESATAEGAGEPGPAPFFPFTDAYGQYVHADWPGKIRSDADFAARRREEEEEMRAHPGPPDWDRWGGWVSGPKREATGFFRPEKVNGRWWLVDPEGRLFWSYGPTGVGFGEGTPVTGKERWFAALPAEAGPFARYWGKGKGARYMYYADGAKEWRSFDFSGANAERKYGREWRRDTADLMHRRLRNWGCNTIANWSDSAVYLRRRTPYVVAIHYGGPWLEHIPDVFAPTFAAAVRERMEKERGTTAGDPWNVGYFVDNELAWGYKNKAELAVEGALRAAPTSATKRALVDDLRAKYADIAALNAAWGSDYGSWDALLEARTLPRIEKPGPARGEDLGAFGLKFAERYFSTVREAVKRVAPDNLYLGCRFHGHIDAAVVQVAAKYADVISYNVYESPNGRLNQYLGKVDKPFLVGEFGVGSDLGQTPLRGEVQTYDPAQRARALEGWVNQAVRHPLLVGAHFFQFRDQPLTGRADGEATLRGFVNVADTPHFDLVQVNRRLGYGLYRDRSVGAG